MDSLGLLHVKAPGRSWPGSLIFIARAIALSFLPTDSAGCFFSNYALVDLSHFGKIIKPGQTQQTVLEPTVFMHPI